MMDGEEVAKACADARDRGASAFGIVNSGRGPTKREWPKIMEAVHAMKEVDGICHCATLGTLSEEQARDLKAAGVRRINHNLETSREFYPQIVGTHTWQERVDTVRLAQRVGLETCCGCIFGMGETIDDRVSLAFSLKELNPSVVPLNFLFPIPGTPLENAPRLRPMEILKIIAVMRLILPRQDLKVAGGREKNLPRSAKLDLLRRRHERLDRQLPGDGRPAQPRRFADDRGSRTELARRPRRRCRPGHCAVAAKCLHLGTTRTLVIKKLTTETQRHREDKRIVCSSLCLCVSVVNSYA